jgi:hypothetical protein
MEKIYSKYIQDKLLHLVNRMSDIVESPDKRRDLSPTDQFLQMSTLKLPKGQTFKAHKHLWRKGEDQIIPQESWIVIRGRVKFIYYDVNDQPLGETILEQGDCSMTFEGGHTYEIMESNTIVYEVKSAVYYGQEKDKVFI